jgi:hypothetical protein
MTRQPHDGGATRQPPASTHRFRVGQMVRMRARFGGAAGPAEFYRVVSTLPPRDNFPQYRIRNETERHERVAREDDLEATDGANSAARTAPDPRHGR